YPMDSRSEIQEKIKSLQSARLLLNAKIESLDTAVRQIDEEIAVLTESMKQLSFSIQDDPFWKQSRTRDIVEFFAAKGITIVELTDKLTGNQEEQFVIAKTAWKCYGQIEPLFKKLAKEKNPFEYDFPDDDSHTGKSDFFQVIAKLKQLGLIAVDRKKNNLSISRSDKISGGWTPFFDGRWAELAARSLIEDTVRKFMSKHPLSYGIWSNIKLKKLDSANQHDMELDVVVNLCNDKAGKHHIYIFEIKSGRNWRIDRWVDSARLFQDSQEKNIRFITCCTDPDVDPMIFALYRLCSLQNLETQLTGFLNRDFKNEEKNL
ncbi:MAG: hypothetical protein IKO93_01220, partial [Lentisphaeria bacterium]|nr:hypothetical protein [Lentisphaeria bacterium]